ncbi:MAG: hypothetical protein Q9217_004728 [Psora testacea]
MALDNGHVSAADALPTPTDTIYETPLMGVSRRSSRHGSSSPFTNSPPVPFSPEDGSYFPRLNGDIDPSHAEKRSSIDTRRFTSDLDNSLIQQIHSLRLELENKNIVVGSLEENLHQSQTTNEQLSEHLSLQETETQSLRKEMQLLENGTLAALGDMAKERDDAVNVMVDTRKRLEASTKKIRSQEEDAEKAYAIRGKEQEDWDNEKRSLERKVHVMENRLKTMIAELVAVESTGFTRPGSGAESDQSIRDMLAKADAYSVRSDSRAGSRMSTRSNDDAYDRRDSYVRAPSRLSALHEVGGSKTTSLAEELEGEGEENGGQYNVEHEPESPETLPEELLYGPERYSEDHMARKMMGLPMESYEVSNGDGLSGQHSIGIIMDHTSTSIGRNSLIQYTDSASQCSPPSSPKSEMQRSSSITTKPEEQTANQRRKRVAIPSMFLEQTPIPKDEAPKASSMVCTGCQTDDAFSSSTMPDRVIMEPEPLRSPSMSHSSTQTSDDPLSSVSSVSTRLMPPAMDVPVIAIHPPSSRPPSSHTSVVLPPRTKNAGCQATLDTLRSSRSTSMQTDEIRVDMRAIHLPPRLHSSHALAQSTSRSSERRKYSGSASRAKVPKRNLRSPPPILQHDPPPASPPVETIKDAYPGNNDNGPLNNKQHHSGPRRPIRSDSIFAGFSDENEELVDKVGDDYSDEELAHVAPIRKTLSKVNNSWKLVPQSTNSVLERLESASDDGEAQAKAGSSETGTRDVEQFPKMTSKTLQSSGTTPPLNLITTKQVDIRRTALVSSGSTAHAQRQRSPSAPDQAPTEVAPPFPVPTRSSSRKIPISASDGAGSPTPYSTTFFATRRHQGRPPVKRKILRKVQSAAAVTKPPIPSRPPPPLPVNTTSSNPPSTPKSPLPPRNQFILPYPSESEQKTHSVEVLSPQSRAGEASIESSNRQTSVVDAIAQTMVGEWMWKYVRKRTSFGITETPQAEFEMGKNGESGNSGGARHKRWVWLAPYERAVIWSSKQPTSGPALLGKGGRKLAIQSVLDVKDDTPLPKGSTNEAIFDRSILILTPERALKFTATSKERHYIWLTALSFLSASNQGATDLATTAPEQQANFPRPPSMEPAVSYRRTPIRDSIRVSKAKSRPWPIPRSFSSPRSEEGSTTGPPSLPQIDYERVSEDAAEAPQVPRVAAHARKRSSTGPRPAPLSAYHSYPSDPVGIASNLDLQQPTAREKYERYRPYSRRNSGQATTVPSTITRRTTEPSIVPNNFFDAVGTVRMEAFVDNRKENRREEKRREKEAKSGRNRQGRKKDMSYWGVSGGMRGEAKWRKEDPFSEF